MHILLLFLNLLVVSLASTLMLHTLNYVRSWVTRRSIHYLILLMPTATLSMNFNSFHQLFHQFCLLLTPTWDSKFSVLLPLSMILITLGAVGLGIFRLFVMKYALRRWHLKTHAVLQQWTNDTAQQLRASPPRVFYVTYDKPLAFTYGLWNPTIVLSTWMLEHLDQREVEAVLSHELEHIVRHDYLLIWLATILRDAFFYLPMTWTAYRQLQREKELACDDGVVYLTQRPLALASALTKVWLYSLEHPQTSRFTGAQFLAAQGTCISNRIQRLVDSSKEIRSTSSSRWPTVGLYVFVSMTLLLTQSFNFILILSFIHCNPLAVLEKIFVY